jgi:hypothetical protein
MNGKRTFLATGLALVLGVFLVAAVAAAPPWAKFMSAKSVEADPDKPYVLKEENGPWMIMACSFSGEGAEKQAHDLVLELRKRYQIETYSHKVGFKLDDPNAGYAAENVPVRWQYRRFKDHPDLYKDGAIKEYAVVVGNFPAVDDPEIQKALQKIKHLQPECLNVEAGRPQSRTLAALRAMQDAVRDAITPDNSDKRKKGPMGHAFITTNPLLPPDYYAPKGLDELVLKMNKGVTHSLLDCPGKYTVQVAHFTGEVIFDQRKIQEAQVSSKTPTGLAKAAEAAHELTEVLRKKGYEAYEFHDRYASLVTVGSFDSVGTPRPDGKIEINPQIHLIMKTFGGAQADAPQVPGAVSVKSIAVPTGGRIPLDYQPIPVEVPKRSISRELARRVEG